MNDLRSRRTFLKLGLAAAGGAFLAACGFTPPAPPPEGAPNDFGALAVAVPAVVGTATWKARPPTDTITVLNVRPTRILVHHTDTANTADTSLSAAYTLARGIQVYHQDTNGWADSGQHFTISRGGHILEGRTGSLAAAQNGARHVSGAHCPGQNDVAVGIENEGRYMTVAPPAALQEKLVALCAWLCERYGISAAEIYGHRDFYATDCPGDVLYGQLPKLRADVAARLGTRPRFWPTTRSGQSGERVRTVQYLLRARGGAVTPDGAFGSGTKSAVSAFQSGAALHADGTVGSSTWERLVLTVREGDSGDAVRAAQSQLASKGYAVAVDGAFGPGTAAAVRSFQSSRGLVADGVVGPNTWVALVG